MYIYASYLAAYKIANIFTKKAALALPPFHAFTGCDKVILLVTAPEIIRVVFAYTFFYTIEKVVLDHQLTKPKVVSLTRPALLKDFKGTVNHAGHI